MLFTDVKDGHMFSIDLFLRRHTLEVCPDVIRLQWFGLMATERNGWSIIFSKNTQ